MSFITTVVKSPPIQDCEISMVKQGILVRVDGKQSTVETSWAQGKHVVTKLADGRQIFDLDQLIIDKKAKIESIPEANIDVPMPPVKEPKKWSV